MDRVSLAVIHRRSSTREFTEDSVPASILRELVKAAMAAPSGRNLQPWKFVIVNNKKLLSDLSIHLPYAKMALNASAGIVVCGDLTKPRDVNDRLWEQDCAAATQNILIAAEAFELGAVWTALFPYNERIDVVSEILQLTKDIVPFCLIPIGYKRAKQLPKDKYNVDKIIWKL